MNFRAVLKNSIGLVKDKKARFAFMTTLGLYNNMPDEKFVRKLYEVYLGKELNLENPQTFNEKLQWLKLYDRNPQYTKMVDKYEVKKYVADKIGEEYIIPTLGVWDKFEDIDFDALPEQFVLKCTHDSGGIVICKDKNNLDLNAAKRKIDKSLKTKFFYIGREWPYKDVKPRIIAEKYMEDKETEELRDYKFFCFDGEAKVMFTATERQNKSTETKFDFFDMNYEHLPFTNGHPNADVIPQKPEMFDKMRELAEALSAGMRQIRVDFYEVNGQIYFGELTFFHWGGLVPFVPEEWDYKMGEMINLK